MRQSVPCVLHTIREVGKILECLCNRSNGDYIFVFSCAFLIFIVFREKIFASHMLILQGICKNKFASRYVLLHHVMGELEGNKKEHGATWKVGMGSVTQAMARSAASFGANIFTDTVFTFGCLDIELGC